MHGVVMSNVLINSISLFRLNSTCMHFDPIIQNYIQCSRSQITVCQLVTIKHHTHHTKPTNALVLIRAFLLLLIDMVFKPITISDGNKLSEKFQNSLLISITTALSLFCDLIIRWRLINLQLIHQFNWQLIKCFWRG